MESAPIWLRVATAVITGFTIFTVSLVVFFEVISAATGYREVGGTAAILLVGLLLVLSLVATIVAVRFELRIMKDKPSKHHIVALLVLTIGLLLLGSAPFLFVY